MFFFFFYFPPFSSFHLFVHPLLGLDCRTVGGPLHMAGFLLCYIIAYQVNSLIFITFLFRGATVLYPVDGVCQSSYRSRGCVYFPAMYVNAIPSAELSSDHCIIKGMLSL